MTDPFEAARTVVLSGRYNAVLSVLPYILLTLVFFFIACFFLVLILFQDVHTVFEILLLPFVLGMAMLIPFLGVFLFMIRWHGKRRMELDNSGATLIFPKGKSVYVPWEFMIAVELRYSKPNLIHCTLVSPAMRFSFSNLEVNLEHRVPLNRVFMDGFDVVKLRDFLYYLHRKAPQISWRMGESFKERYKIKHPPYDLEKLV